MKLTDTQCRTAKPTERVSKLGDGDGLFLAIRPSGHKSWQFYYRHLRKQKIIVFGSYPELPLAKARQMRVEARSQVAAGIDPMGERKAAELVENTGPLPTWRDVAEEFEVKRHKEGAAKATLDKLAWCLEITYGAFGSRLIDEISAKDVLDLLQSIEAKGQFETAKRLRSVCSRVFRFGVATLRCERDPAADLKGALTVVPVKHHAAIFDLEGIGGLMRAVRNYAGSPITRAGLLILAYTFLRPGEVRHLEWADVDFDAAQIKVPGERMKQRRAHIVPLAAQVVAVLRDIKRLTGESELVLPGHGAGRVLSENTMNAALRRMDFSRDEMVSHGFRRIASTRLNEMGWNRDWIERQLAHVEGNNVRRAYNAAEYLEGRTEMMQGYADHLDKLACHD
jgi:integrase